MLFSEFYGEYDVDIVFLGARPLFLLLVDVYLGYECVYDLGSQLLNVNKSVGVGNEIVYRIPFTSIARFGFFKLGELFASVDCSDS